MRAKKEEELLKKQGIKKIVSKIRILESSGGVADSCKKQGKINGFGYRQNAHERVCYDSYTEVSQHVENWVVDKLNKGMSLGQALCYYNTGTASNTCLYYERFKTL